jgi:hypothetical protein
MTISFENDNDVIVYTLEKIIAFARNNQYIFLAQSVWWISSIIGLQQELIVHIDNIRGRSNIRDQKIRALSATPRDLSLERVDKSLTQTEQFIKESEDSRKIYNTRVSPKENWIHPERRRQVQDSNPDISDLDLNNHSTPEDFTSSNIFRKQSRKERNAFNETAEGSVDPNTIREGSNTERKVWEKPSDYSIKK